MRTLPLSPLDGFVLSRVDGNATVADIADLTSLETDLVISTLEKLVGFDAVEWADGTTSLPSRSVPPPAGPAGSRQGGPKPMAQARTAAVPMRSPRESAAGGWPMPQSPAAPSPAAPSPPPAAAPTPEPLTPRAPTLPGAPPVKVFGAPPSRSQSGDRFGAVIPRAPSVQMPAVQIPAVQAPKVTPLPSSLSRAPSVRPPPSEEQRDAGMHVHGAREAPLVETFESKPRHPTSPGTLTPPEVAPSEARRPVSVARFPATKVSPRGPTPAPYVPGTSPVSALGVSSGTTPMPGSVPLQRIAIRSQGTDATDTGANKAFQEAPPTLEPKVAPAAPAPAAPAPPAAPAAPAPPAAPAEPENDLSDEKRKRIDDFYVIADLLDHYQVLGIARTVDRTGVKSAYFELSKVFHPDTAFRKNVGTYRHKMEVIFKRLTEAYDVLSKKKLRDEYDAYLARSDQSQTMEETLSGQHNVEELLAQMKAASAPVASPPPEPAPRVVTPAPPSLPEPPRTPPPSPAPSPRAGTPAPAPTFPLPSVEERTMSDAAKRRAQELLAKRLDAGRSAAGNTRPLQPPPPPPPPPKASKSEVIRELTNSLKHAAQLTGVTHDPVQRQIQDARATLERGDLSEAVRRYRHVLLLQPDNQELQAEHERAAHLLAASLADNYAQQAVYEERHKKWAAAAASWAKVAEGRPNDAGAHWRSAKALLEANGDVKEAAKLARRAVDLAPEDVFAARTLGRAYLAAGMTLNARRELERAVLLDPNDIPTKALLKEIKG